MGWHVHHKDGDFAIWSTIVDAYITPFTSERQVIALYAYQAMKEAEETAKKNIEEARKTGCSVIYSNFKCEIDTE